MGNPRPSEHPAFLWRKYVFRVSAQWMSRSRSHMISEPVHNKSLFSYIYNSLKEGGISKSCVAAVERMF